MGFWRFATGRAGKEAVEAQGRVDPALPEVKNDLATVLITPKKIEAVDNTYDIDDSIIKETTNLLQLLEGDSLSPDEAYQFREKIREIFSSLWYQKSKYLIYKLDNTTLGELFDDCYFIDTQKFQWMVFKKVFSEKDIVEWKIICTVWPDKNYGAIDDVNTATSKVDYFDESADWTIYQNEDLLSIKNWYYISEGVFSNKNIDKSFSNFHELYETNKKEFFEKLWKGRKISYCDNIVTGIVGWIWWRVSIEWYPDNSFLFIGEEVVYEIWWVKIKRVSNLVNIWWEIWWLMIGEDWKKYLFRGDKLIDKIAWYDIEDIKTLFVVDWKFGWIVKVNGQYKIFEWNKLIEEIDWKKIVHIFECITNWYDISWIASFEWLGKQIFKWDIVLDHPLTEEYSWKVNIRNLFYVDKDYLWWLIDRDWKYILFEELDDWYSVRDTVNWEEVNFKELINNHLTVWWIIEIWNNTFPYYEDCVNWSVVIKEIWRKKIVNCKHICKHKDDFAWVVYIEWDSKAKLLIDNKIVDGWVEWDCIYSFWEEFWWSIIEDNKTKYYLWNYMFWSNSLHNYF